MRVCIYQLNDNLSFTLMLLASMPNLEGCVLCLTSRVCINGKKWIINQFQNKLGNVNWWLGWILGNTHTRYRYVYLSVYISVYIVIHTDTCTHTHTHTHIHICIWIYMCVCMYIPKSMEMDLAFLSLNLSISNSLQPLGTH